MKTKIEWATDVWNPVTGCQKVSEGCRNCYAERMAGRFWKERKFNQVICNPGKLDDIASWYKPRRVFVNSMSDLFHDDVPDKFIDQVFSRMAVASQHTFLILTKRPRRMYEYFNRETLSGWSTQQIVWHDAMEVFRNLWKPANSLTYDTVKTWPLKNVWLGVSVENQKAADERIPLLLQTPAAVRFVSCEPLLGPLNLECWMHSKRCSACGQWWDVNRDYCLNCGGHGVTVENQPVLNWVICGGESGPNARPMHPEWARSLWGQCKAAGLPFFFKQWGEWAHESQIWKDPMAPMIQLSDAINQQAYRVLMFSKQAPEDRGYQFEDGSISYRVGKKAAGRLLDEQEWNEFPRSEGSHD